MQDVELIHGLFVVLVLIFSVVAHEVSHGYMAQYLGDPTARFAGRLTMNPLKHLDPIGSVLVPILTALSQTGLLLGWAKPVPYNPYNLRDQKWGDAKVALAGPFTNIGIALFFAIILRSLSHLFTPAMLDIIDIIIRINITLAVFNLVPIPPLDGSKVLLNALPLRYRYIGEYLERYSLVLVFVFAIFLWGYFFPLVSLLYRFLVGSPMF
jgi:Zn-dependent protease